MSKPIHTSSDTTSGYHLTEITKGTLGELSKIQEELDEAKDALAQASEILLHVELSDIYGALEAVAEHNGTNMDELKKMSDITKRAFINGHRS